MPLTVGTRLGPYEIAAPLGAGGMGEVYRARDTKLKRDVALKVLSASFAGDPERLARFQREAEVLASLNHPNIAQIYGVEDRAIVMELVEGDSPQGPLPFDEAWKIATQIAAGLEYAHDKGIVHRDLKPANIKITPDGVVKLLDFGLAKAFTGQTPVSGSMENSPTLTLGATQLGVILGTAAYMAPEQAKGKPVDKRADIWAFGVVLYELLTGERLFTGEDVSDTLAHVLTMRPNFEKAPAQVRRLLRDCLEKDPKQRLRDVGDATRLLDAETQPVATTETQTSAPARPWWKIAAGLLLTALLGLSFVHFRETPPPARLVRTSILPPDRTSFDFVNNRGPAALSPDGQRIVFTATNTSDGKSQLWVRPVEALSAQPIAGTDGASFPFWSPDSRFIGFFAGGKLKKIDTAGGPPLTLADAPNARGGTWSPAGVIVFSPNNNAGSLDRVSAAGGTVTAATAINPQIGANPRFPWFLPDGKHFLYAIEGRGEKNGRTLIYAGLLDSKESVFIGESTSFAAYSQGHLLFLRDETLMAQPFDAGSLKVLGDAVPVAEQVVGKARMQSTGFFSVSENGLLLYQAGATAAQQRLTWYDRSGKPEGTLGEPAEFGYIDFSPDRKSLAATIIDRTGNKADVWIFDVARALPTRFTFDQLTTRVAVWSSDGKFIIFDKGSRGLYKKAANGASAEELLYTDERNKEPSSWSPDGKYLLYRTSDPKSSGDIWILPLAPQQPGAPLKPAPFLQTGFNEFDGKFSPDGRWIAYRSNESSRTEIYAVPFRGPGAPPGGKRQISTNGGTFPRWRADGKEIFFIAPDQRLMAAEVKMQGDVLAVGAVHPLFGPLFTSRGYPYDVSADGQKILATLVPERVAEPLTLVENWTAGLKK